MQPPTLKAYLLAGQIFEAEGEKNQALFAYQQALSLDPENTLAKQGVERLSESN
jgi:tetratricopeptide (TPR) repeat protein